VVIELGVIVQDTEKEVQL